MMEKLPQIQWTFSRGVLIAVAGLCMTSATPGPASGAAEFLNPLPLQTIRVGQAYTLGIRPSNALAIQSVNSKLELFAEGLSANSSFQRVGDQLWELDWYPDPHEQGVHSVRVLVTERGSPDVVLEVEEFTFIVGNIEPVPSSDETLGAAQSLLLPDENTALASVNLSDQTIVIEAATTGDIPLTDLDALESDADSLSQADTTRRAPKPELKLIPLSSHVVTPHQWVRFPVKLMSDSANTNQDVLFQIDKLPNGASFDEMANGGRQFQWRPGTADAGEHSFQFTAVDSSDGSRRESVTMRIIVQE